MRHQRAFTLVEVLVSLTLMSLLVVALFGGFRAGVRSWQLVEQHTARVESPRQLAQVLQRHLGQLLPVFVAEGGVVRPALHGTPNSLRYVAPLAMSVGDQAYLTEWVHDPVLLGPGLWIRLAPYVAGGSVEEMFADAEYQRVAEDVELSFRYYTEEGWGDELGPFSPTPLLLALRIRDPVQFWPEITFPVIQGTAP